MADFEKDIEKIFILYFDSTRVGNTLTINITKRR